MAQARSAHRGRRAPQQPLLGRVSRVLRDAGVAGLGETPLVLAVSGGIDSSVLLRVVAELTGADAGAARLRPFVVHIHHGLRGSEADRDAEFVAECARRHRFACEMVRVAPERVRLEAASSRTRPTLQESARRLRYEVLAQVAVREGARFVATAHTSDDQAETVLLRILRGTGPDGIGGMAWRDPWPAREGHLLEILRPLLSTSRKEIAEFAKRCGVSWREDRSNSDTSYARNRLRHEWLPGLKDAFNPRLAEGLARLAEIQREESRWRDRWVASEAMRRFERVGEDLWIDSQGWDDKALPTALARRLVRRALHELGAGRVVSHRHVERVVAFLREGRVGGVVELPDHITLRRELRGFCLSRSPFPPAGAC